MGNSRTENSIKTVNAGLFQKIVVLGLKFLQRTVFIYILGATYLGISETFSNVLGLLSLSELGIGSAITYYLYVPIAVGDRDSIRSLLRFYKKSYFFIGSFILATGLCLLPLLHYFVDLEAFSGVDMIQVYLLYLLNTAIPYLFYSYKTVLPNADQKQYMVTHFQTGCEVLENLTDIAILLIFRSFMLSLCLRMIIRILGGVLLARRIEKKYAFIKEKKVKPLEKGKVRDIFFNVKDIFIFHIASALFHATDNLVIAYTLGNKQVGYYANYYLLMNAVNNTADMAVYSFHAGIGNVVASESRQKQIQVFHEIDFVNTWVVTFCTVCFAQLLNPFMKIWMGGINDASYILSESFVLVICINYFFEGYMRTLYMFRETKGLFRYGKYRMVAAGIFNVILSLILANYMGLIGVFLATAAANIGFCTFYYPKVVFQYGYGINCRFYRLKMIGDFFFLVGLYGVIHGICFLCPQNGVIGFLLQCIICSILAFLGLYLKGRKSLEWESIRKRMHVLLKNREG